MEMAYNDLSAQYQHLKTEIDAGIAAVLEHTQFISGPQVEELEQALCRYTGRRYCVTVSSGTAALLMALMALKIGPGDAVFVPDFTFFATSEAVSLLGAEPVFCDVLAETFNLDPESLRDQVCRVKKAGRLKPRAVIAVDLYGLPADYPAIEAVCREEGLLLIEDAAQGFGGELAGRKACGFGRLSCTSFFPAKPLGCYGDGGAVFTDEEPLYRLLCSLRVHGKGADKYENIRLGLNARLDTLQAAILLPKLAAFDAENETRNRAAALYGSLLAGSAFCPPSVPADYRSSWAQYTVRAGSEEERAAVRSRLEKAGIPTMVYYPIPLHLQKVYAGLGGRTGDCPVAEHLCKTVFSLPMHGYMEPEAVRQVVAALLRR